MKLKKSYPGLGKTLLYMKAQCIDSFNFAENFLPGGRMYPDEIFDFLKNEVVYYNDPPKIELLQSMQTLLSNDNIHNVYGAGDCDCFTIASLACLHVKGYRNIYVVLAGRRPDIPVHVYAGVDNIPFDLTNDRIGQERKYPFKQWLKTDFSKI